jgi:hypothetical protein
LVKENESFERGYKIMNKTSKKNSDIEEILQSQTWKHKKLQPICLSQKKVRVKGKKNDQETFKGERSIQKCQTMPETSTNTPIGCSDGLSSRIEPKSPLMSLAVPLSILNKAISEISLRNLDLQIPVFPKRSFGKSPSSLPSIPRFKSMKSLGSDQEIIDLKLENGRIRKTNLKMVGKRFKFLDDFNQIANEKVILRMKSGLVQYD